jgi:tetratricopeptide (TPR) repeat protein
MNTVETRHHRAVAKRAVRVPAKFDRPVIISLALAALTAIVYAPVRTFELVNWDDPSYVTDNPIVRGGLTWSSALWAVTTTHSPYWHPMTWLSLLLDVSLFGGDAGAYHVTSAAIHVATTLVLFLLLRRMTGAAGPSAFVAAIFAVHPLHVESVAWIAERKDVLSTFFWVLTIWAYVSYTRAPSAGRYLVVVAWYALALMSKPMVMTLPVVLLLLDWWPLGRFGGPKGLPFGGLFIEKIPLFAMAIATALATAIVQRRVGAVAGLEALPLGARIENAIVSCGVYIWKTVWPANLAAFYPLHAYPLWVVLLAAAALVAITAAAIRVRRRLPHVAVGWLWFLVTVAPVIGLTQAGEQARADRFMYVPMIGLLLIVAFSRWPARLANARLAGAFVLIAASAVASRAQVLTWADSETLWRHAIEVVPRNYLAYQNLGEALRDRNRLDEALTNLRLALEDAPPNSPGLEAMIHNDLGLVLSRKGQTGEAAREFDEAVRLDPVFAEAQLNLANALAAEGRLTDAEPHYAAAIALKPDLVEPQVGLGGVLLEQRRPAEAIPHFETALRLDPAVPQAHNGLGAAYAMQGREADALREYDEALRLDPSLVTAHFNAAVLMLKQGRTDEARRHLDAALQIDPGYAPATQLRARLQ